MVYALPPLPGPRPSTHSVYCLDCSAVTQVQYRQGQGIEPDSCRRCQSVRLEPLDDRDD